MQGSVTRKSPALGFRAWLSISAPRQHAMETVSDLAVLLNDVSHSAHGRNVSHPLVPGPT